MPKRESTESFSQPSSKRRSARLAASDGPTLFDEKEGSELFGRTEDPSALSTVVPLVQCRDGAYSVSPDAIALLETLGDEPVASVAVAGLYEPERVFC